MPTARVEKVGKEIVRTMLVMIAVMDVIVSWMGRRYQKNHIDHRNHRSDS